MSKKILYLVCEMRSEMPVRLKHVEPEIISSLKLKWADGMVGCMPVFESKEAADKYAEQGDGNADILEVYETGKGADNG